LVHNLLRKRLRRHSSLYDLYKNNAFRVITRSIRVLPDFIIIGAGQCGTTSLYNYLIQHPNIYPSSKKEINFFDYNFDKCISWYKLHFPTKFQKFFKTQICKKNFLTGEATPHYLFNPLAPKRVQKTLPKIKLIVILRNPVDRAYSHYSKDVVLGRQTLSFTEILNHEDKAVVNSIHENNNKVSKSFNLWNSLYLGRGIYVDQLKRWMDIFPPQQFLILKSEDLNIDLHKTLNKVFEFLNIGTFEVKNVKRMNVGKYKKMDQTSRNFLIDYYKQHNQLLYKFLGIDFDWDQ